MKKQLKMKVMALVVGSVAALIPFAVSAETDRITVEDPNTQAVKFKVTSDGNVTATGAVTATKFYGDASSMTGLQNGPQGAQGTPGPQGTAGANGTNGAQGAQGAQGVAGSPDTQAQILGKIATPVDASILTIQQGATEAASSVKFAVKDTTGKSNFIVKADGSIGLGTVNPAFKFDFSSDNGTSAIEGKTYRDGATVSWTTFRAKRAYGTEAAPLPISSGAVLGAFTFIGAYNNGSNVGVFTTGGQAGLFAKAEDTFADSTHLGTFFTFETTAPNTGSRTEKLRISGSGNIGIGTTTPTQKLEVNGGVRINTATTKPTCDTTSRGTFWVTQGAAGVKDTVEVCTKDAADAYAWRLLW